MPTHRRDAAAATPTAALPILPTTHAARPAQLPRRDLPNELQDLVPACAKSCLSTYLDQGYECPDDDLSCMCSRYTAQGYSLGELAYLCLKQDCSGQNPEVSGTLYNVCITEAAAVPATHRTLTMPSTSTTSASRRDVTSSEAATRLASSGFVTRTSQTSSVARTESSSTASVASSTLQTPSNTAVAAEDESSGSSGLSAAEAAGISVAAMAILFLIIAACVLVVCRRRRKSKKAKSSTSYNSDVATWMDFSPSSNDNREPNGQSAQGFYTPDGGKPRQLWSERPPKQPSYGKELGTSPQSNASSQSTRTLSQLLPEKLLSEPAPRQRDPSRVARRPSVLSTATEFEEDATTSPRLPGLPAHPNPAHITPMRRPPPPQPGHHPEWPSAQPQQQQSQPMQPSLSLSIPRQAPRPPQAQPSMVFPPPPVPEEDETEDEQRVSNCSKSHSNKSSNSLLNYYAGPDSGSPEPDSTPIEDDAQKRKPAPSTIAVFKPLYPPRAVRRDSIASDTSFESSDPNDPTPPEEPARKLSPVQESPIAGIRYPKVPRSSNQAVPRSPKTAPSPRSAKSFINSPNPHTRISSNNNNASSPRRRAPSQTSPAHPLPSTHHCNPSNTLAAKRRGSPAAEDLERRLHIQPPNAPPPLQGRGQRRSPPNTTPAPTTTATTPGPLRSSDALAYQQARLAALETKSPTSAGPFSGGLRSPAWEPKLTPSKRGEDLYLDVGIATPVGGRFPRGVGGRAVGEAM